MRTRTSWVVALVAVCAGCAAKTPQRSAQESRTGTLRLNLTGTDSQRQSYRLRNAQFQVAGYPQYGNAGYYSVELSSESKPTARVLRARLIPGSYYVTLLNSDWYLERVTAAGAERVERAVLLSPVQQYLYIYDRGTTEVDFTFGVDGDVIDFRHGDLQIGITVELPDDSDGGLLPPPPESDGGVCLVC